MDNSAEEVITVVTAEELRGGDYGVQYLPAVHYPRVDPEQLKALEDRIVERVLADVTWKLDAIYRLINLTIDRTPLTESIIEKWKEGQKND
jgi:hypothetical protein